MKNQFVLATQNEGKVEELQQLLSGYPFQVMTMAQAGLNQDIEETGKSFLENSYIKAAAVHQALGTYVMADDSGLCIDALDGAPGIYSARYLGVSYPERFVEIWKQLHKVPKEKWTTRFVCAITVFYPDGTSFQVEECVEGVITEPASGENGFGYDPIFFLPEYSLTMAEISSEEKNKISHRAKAVKAMLAQLKDT